MEDVNNIIGALAAETAAQHITRGWPAAETADMLPVS